MAYIPDFPLIGIDRILNFVQDRNCPYWAIYDSDKPATSSGQGRQKVSDNWKHEDESVSNGISRLRTFLNDFQETGFVGYLWCKEKSSASSGGFYTPIKIQSPVAHSAIGSSAVMMTPQIDIHAEIAKALNDYKMNQELEALRQENKELKSILNQESATERILSRLEPFVEPMIKGVFGPVNSGSPSPALAGAASPDDDATDIAMKALEELADGDDEFHVKLKKLAELKKSNPQMYQTAITFLN